MLVALSVLGADAVLARQAPAPVAFPSIMQAAERGSWDRKPLGSIMQQVGELLLGQPYEAGLLDQGTEEKIVAPLDRFDCVLFVESVLALARGIVASDTTHAGYLQRIEDQRYRDGTMDGYCSRLHYFSDWISDNERRGTLRNITGDLGGARLDKSLTFMGSHRSAYPRLAASDSLFAGILEMEETLAGLEILHVPQSRIAETYPLLRAGDIVAITTALDGLDVVHTGLVHATADGGRGLLHASITGSVVVSPDLQQYVQNNRSQIGIVVARPVDPRFDP